MSPPWLAVLKLEAFGDRGGDDPLESRDFTYGVEGALLGPGSRERADEVTILRRNELTDG